MSWWSRTGPEERAAQERLDAAQESGERLTLEQAEKLSDDVWVGREIDRGIPQSDDREAEA